jgi:hypothetical protein
MKPILSAAFFLIVQNRLFYVDLGFTKEFANPRLFTPDVWLFFVDL